ncbi:MAG TPA: hypothetical protein VNG51_29905 [Ktedonobacteraceae bacterium]|nr:hypothetical protein [Ktedonobacteraceae bacterium]
MQTNQSAIARLHEQSDEDTLILPRIKPLVGGPAFCAFLHAHHLTIVDVALAGKMRLLPVWHLSHDVPIKLREARAIRETVYQLAGERFTAPIAIVPSEWL